MIEGEKEKAVSPATLIDPLIPRNLNATMERTDDTSEKVATTPMDHPITHRSVSIACVPLGRKQQVR